jgi:hypothetical protein
MTDEILQLHLEISAYVFELHELQKVIKDLDKSDTDPIFIQEAGERYLNLCNKLRILLEAFFAEEAKVGLPTEFAYRKLYKQLKA